VIASSEPLEGRAVSDVRLNSSAASAEVIDRLAKLGKHRFSYLSGRASSYVDKQRMAWFAAALAEHGLAFEQVVHGDYSYESGFKETVLLLRRASPDVLICANDLMAIGAQDAAALLGIAVPEGLSIVGHDGVALASWDCHSLTTIMPPPNAVSDALAEIIEATPSAAPIQRVVDCQVRWGRSTGFLGS
jgi:DNA-binding LacI/PurR family transcriptional regulator